jgi:hypothetical protein
MGKIANCAWAVGIIMMMIYFVLLGFGAVWAFLANLPDIILGLLFFAGMSGVIYVVQSIYNASTD